MRDIWYADNRDLVKWSVLIHLAKLFCCKHILQIPYFREDFFPCITIDDKKIYEIPPEVKSHFRDIGTIKKLSNDLEIDMLDAVFDDRKTYLNKVKKFISQHHSDSCIVFLDPDTGLEPANPNMKHVLNSEAAEVWGTLKYSDVFVFYQHQTNRNGQPWIDQKKNQLANSIQVPEEDIKIAHGFDIARDVVFFYARK